MKSKENKILELFFEEPAKEWHFEEIIKTAKIARSKAAGWLKKLEKEKIIKRTKEKGKMPHYTSRDSIEYKNKKRLFAYKRLYQTGLLNHLSRLKKAKTIILFGSFARWDWYKGSDIDIFIYGDPEGLNMAKYELKLDKDIQLFVCKDKHALKKLGSGLIQNIIQGNIIKGNLDFLKVKLHA